MMTGHAEAEPCAPLDRIFNAIVEAAAPRDTFHALHGGELRAVSVGWPVLRRMRSEHAEHATAAPFRDTDVLIELSASLRPELDLSLVIPARHAAAWVDRALGGADSGLPSSSGALSEPELGVLAYLAARVTEHASTSLAVRDVRPAAIQEEHVAWPFTLHTSHGRVDALALLAPARARSITHAYRLCVSVTDRAPQLLRPAVGDVWVGDWALSSTSSGPVGDVELSVEGCSERLAGVVSRGAVRAVGVAHASELTELVIGSRAVSLLELATLAAGGPLALPRFERAALRQRGETLAEGELVQVRGVIGIRVDRA